MDRQAARNAAFPNKSRFPESWTDDDIVDAVDLTMAAPDVVEHYGDQFTFEKMIEGQAVRVSVWVDKPFPFVWTAYPKR